MAQQTPDYSQMQAGGQMETGGQTQAGGQQDTGAPSLFGGSWPVIKPGEIPSKLTIDEVTRIQKMAARTGNPILAETARKASELAQKGESEGPGVHRAIINPQEAAELLQVAVATQDKELADFARYAQSVADTTQLGLEPEPGKIQQLTEKGKEELEQMKERGEQPHQYPPGMFGAGVGPAFQTVGGPRHPVLGAAAMATGVQAPGGVGFGIGGGPAVPPQVATNPIDGGQQQWGGQQQPSGGQQQWGGEQQQQSGGQQQWSGEQQKPSGGQQWGGEQQPSGGQQGQQPSTQEKGKSFREQLIEKAHQAQRQQQQIGSGGL
jgi:flagellar hook-basal body complex protein FliE